VLIGVSNLLSRHDTPSVLFQVKQTCDRYKKGYRNFQESVTAFSMVSAYRTLLFSVLLLVVVTYETQGM
jgi:hypothetical protein